VDRLRKVSPGRSEWAELELIPDEGEPTRIRVDQLRRVLPPNTILARIQMEATAE
jgi:hypothetical protein